MTRQEYLKQEIEKCINDYILPTLQGNKKTYENYVSFVNLIAFMYGVGRMKPLTTLMKLARVLTQEDFDNLIEKYEEQGE